MEKQVSRSFKVNGLEIKTGNHKIGFDTLIFNMGSATTCPSKKLGMCKVPDGKCYALAPEKMYPTVKPYRDRQEKYWKETDIETIKADLRELMSKKSKYIKRLKYFRFNEAGDFWSQTCVSKLDAIATMLKEEYSLLTYGYTARTDLDFSNVSFLVKGSNNDNGNNVKTMVIEHIEDKPKDFVKCPYSKTVTCRNCNFCKSDKKLNIAFLLH